ncbi:hypothetical protein [Cohnella cholangitidis]|uniref:Uncharacterized protein n=1 Tax=Cohnella cholangitidis TaxID=2598458 RepID=A0A7G5BTI6_9BACL|nr:hypothetical protein [Cohnella cholangitidis]QMV40270.1 hypothetical protein FPL14_02940 [Cohnella cholangitidis]
MTLVTMNKQDFDSLNDEGLGSACMEPTFRLIRGKNVSVKTQVISGLTKGQQALCLFRVMYDHAKNSAAELYGWTSYLHDQPGYWTGVTGALSFFGDRSLLALLEETEEMLHGRNVSLGLRWSDASPTDVEYDPELQRTMNGLFNRFQTLAPLSIRIVGDYIRANPQEYVSFEP